MMTTGRADFYAKAHGVVMRNLLTRHLEAVIASSPSPSTSLGGDKRIAAVLGYGAPYRRVLEAAFMRVLDFRECGGTAPDAPQGRSAVVDDGAGAGTFLPVASKSLDLLMVVHGRNHQGRFAEYARVLNDHGRLVLVAPCHDTGKPPFGGEGIYSAKGLRQLLESHGFEVSARRALVLPIWEGEVYCRFAPIAEKAAWLPCRSGVVIVDAGKMIYSVRGVGEAQGQGQGTRWPGMAAPKRATIG